MAGGVWGGERGARGSHTLYYIHLLSKEEDLGSVQVLYKHVKGGRLLYSVQVVLKYMRGGDLGHTKNAKNAYKQIWKKM